MIGKLYWYMGKVTADFQPGIDLVDCCDYTENSDRRNLLGLLLSDSGARADFLFILYADPVKTPNRNQVGIQQLILFPSLPSKSQTALAPKCRRRAKRSEKEKQKENVKKALFHAGLLGQILPQAPHW
jgi:hypothetical protein